MADQEDRTEPASAKRLQTARGEGQVAVSREVSPLLVLGAGTLVLAWLAPSMARGLAERLTLFLASSDRLDPVFALRMAGMAMLVGAAPFVLASLVAGVAATFLQTGFLFRPAALLPDLARLSPLRGLGRLLSPAVLLESAKSLAKLGLVAWAAWQALAAALPQLPQAMFWPPGMLAAGATRAILRLLVGMLAVQAVIAALDVLWERTRHARGLRMSRQELREEHRESEGDPRIKARIRRLRGQRARRRMMQAVPKATIVLTNPTHFAVALAYDRAAGGAPRVVAKGMDEMAARIRAVAEASRVPVLASPPLARALFRVELDSEIPAEHYKAVAELIAYVWRLRGRAPGVVR
jgi:flagellar biosynthetic protein FlhB